MKEQKREQILVVDDHIRLRKVLGDYLRFEGFDVLTAGSAEECLKVLESTTPDLIVLDLVMPGMGGIGFLRSVRRPDGSLPLPVLVFTAHPCAAEFLQNIKTDGLLHRPCSQAELMDRIRSILDGRNPAASSTGLSARQVLLAEDNAGISGEAQHVFAGGRLRDGGRHQRSGRTREGSGEKA